MADQASERVLPATGWPDTILARTELVTVGAFRCDVSHPLFQDSGPIERSCFVFPRTAVTIAHEGAAPFVADANTITLYNKGQRYRRQPIAPSGDRCDWYGVSRAVLREAVRPHDPAAADDPERVMRHAHARSTAALYLRQRELFAAVERRSALVAPAADPLGVEEGVLSLLDDVLAHAYNSRVAPTSGPHAFRQRGEIVDAAKRLIGRDIAAPWTLARLSRAIGCSPFHLCRSFRELAGITLHDYRSELRLRSALELMDDGLDLTAVALAIGYSSHSHFTSAFHRVFGAPPSRLTVRKRRQGEVSRRARF